MIEKIYQFSQAETKTIERIIEDDHVAINHMVLKQGDALPEHYSNSNTYLVIIKGKITLRLNEQEKAVYPSFSIINVPYKTKMNVSNQDEVTLEFFVIKAPSPKNYVPA